MASPTLLEQSRPEGTAAPPTKGQAQWRRRAWLSRTHIGAFVAYAGVALLANYPEWPGDPSRIRAGDLDQMVWYLAWTPHALVHWQNPFATTWMNYPEGVNLAQNTSVPLLGFVTAPLTLAVSPIASLNLLLWLAFPLSAFSMFVVLRRWAQWDLAAFLGGALYGFSPYVVAQSQEHLNLAFVPLPPLILLAGYETIRPRAKRPMRWGVALGALVVAQFFISPEVAATTVLVVALCAAALAAANPGAVILAVQRAGRALAAASGIVVAGLAYPTWMMTEGPYRYHGPAYPSGFSADLMSSVTPTPLQLLTPGRLDKFGSHLMFGNLTENGAYLGIPLVLLLAVLVGLCWRNRWIRFAAGLGLLTTILSLGARLTVDNHVTRFPLPWALLRHMPLANNIIVARLSLYTYLFAALIVALGMAELRARWHRSRSDVVGGASALVRGRTVRVGVGCGLGVLMLASALSLVPSWPFKTAPAKVPSFFTSAASARIPYGSVALISPYPSVAEVQPQMWQAVAKMRFRIIGGYALVPGLRGTSTNFPEVLQPKDVQQFLWAKATGGRAYPAGRVPSDDHELVCQLRSFLLRYRVATVISTTADAQPRPIDALYDQAMGPPNFVGAGVTVWYSVPGLVDARIRSCTT